MHIKQILVLPQDSNYSGELQCHCHPKKQEIFLNELPEIQKQVRRKKKLNKRRNNGRNKGERGRKMGGGIRGEKENKTKHVIQSNKRFVSYLVMWYCPQRTGLLQLS